MWKVKFDPWGGRDRTCFLWLLVSPWREGNDIRVLKSGMNESFIINRWSITILLTKGSQKSALLICAICHFARVGIGFFMFAIWFLEKNSLFDLRLSQCQSWAHKPLGCFVSTASDRVCLWKRWRGGGGVISGMKAGRPGNNPAELTLRRLLARLKPGWRERSGWAAGRARWGDG